jgi:hypothetical protein
MNLTNLELAALSNLWASSNSNGHDFGFTEDLPAIKASSRGGVVGSLQKKGLISVEDTINGYTQFTFTDKGRSLFVDFETSATLENKTMATKTKSMKTSTPKTSKKAEKPVAKKAEKKVKVVKTVEKKAPKIETGPGELTGNQKIFLAALKPTANGGKTMTRNDLKKKTGVKKGYSKALGAATKEADFTDTSLEGRGLIKSRPATEGESGLQYHITAKGLKALAK